MLSCLGINQGKFLGCGTTAPLAKQATRAQHLAGPSWWGHGEGGGVNRVSKSEQDTVLWGFTSSESNRPSSVVGGHLWYWWAVPFAC